MSRSRYPDHLGAGKYELSDGSIAEGYSNAKKKQNKIYRGGGGMSELYKILKEARDIADYENRPRISEGIEILLEVINLRANIELSRTKIFNDQDNE